MRLLKVNNLTLRKIAKVFLALKLAFLQVLQSFIA